MVPLLNTVIKQIKGRVLPKKLIFQLMLPEIVLVVSDNMSAAPGRILDKS